MKLTATTEALDTTWDVIVAGAGPAGATAARHLVERGRTVLLIDRHAFPREKVCGDGLIPDALRCLDRAGLGDRVRRQGYCTDTVSVFSPSQLRVDVPGDFVTIRRDVLDTILVEDAIARGVAFCRGEVTAAESKNGGVHVACRGWERAAQARCGVLATGADIAVLTQAGMVRRRQPSGVAARCYIRSPVTVEQLVVSFDRSVLPGYGWIFPLGNDEYNVGCGIFYTDARSRGANLRDLFDAFTARFPLANQLFRRADSVSPLRGAKLRTGLCGAASWDGGRVVAVGEAIGATYPFTGEGIGKAMETGELAAAQLHRLLDTNDVAPMAELSTLIEQQLGPRYVGYEIAQHWASKPWLVDLIVRRIHKSPALIRAAAGVLNERVDPREIFRAQTLIPFWKGGR